MIIRVLGLAVVCALIPTSALAQSNWLKDKVNAVSQSGVTALKQTKLSDTKIGEGLKEALKVGITNAVQSTGKVDGFLKNDAIKILMPEKLRTLEKGLRMVGMGKPVDDFVVSMNRSAEAAAPAARDIFLNTLFEMNFDDVQKLYKGGPSAATEFFKGKTRQKLYEAFKPAVDKQLRQNDVVEKYKLLADKYRTLPLAKNLPAPAIDEYVINKALDGLFVVMGEEEKKIRENPQARVSTILQEVFK
jgi:hypothetical protein